MTHSHDLSIDPRIVQAASEGCAESRLLISRRHMMALSASFFAAGMIPRTALASSSSDRRLLIVMLRGGMDGLNVLMPINDAVFREQRRPLMDQISSGSLLNLTGYPDYKLHPNLPNFAANFNAGKALIIEGVAPPLTTRSHFQCQYNIETGMGADNPTVSEGWLNRLLARLPVTADRTSSGAMPEALAISDMPMILTGRAPVTGWWFLNNAGDFRFAEQLKAYYQKQSPTMHRMLTGGVATNELTKVAGNRALLSLASRQGTSSVQQQFRGAAKLMSASDGPRIGVISIEGWDTHINQSHTSDKGLGDRLTTLDMGLKDFETQMGTQLWANTAVLIVTEFGRTIEVNAGDNRAGTEHGRATLALLVGGNVKGKTLRGRPPNLAWEMSNTVDHGLLAGRHDLTPHVDMRRIFKAALTDHLGVDNKIAEEVFVGSSEATKMINLFRNS